MGFCWPLCEREMKLIITEKKKVSKKKLYAKWNDFCENQSQKWNDVMTSKMNYRSNETNAVTAKWQKSKNAKTRGMNNISNETTAATAVKWYKNDQNEQMNKMTDVMIS